MSGSLGLGLVIGLVAGAGGMYLALEKPWAGHGTQVRDAGVVAVAPSDAGVKKPGKRHGRPHGGGGNLVNGGEEGWGGGDQIEETGPQLVQLSPADRALEWRGDDTSPPKQTIDMNSGKEARPLDDSEIQSVISEQSGPVQSCVMQAATNTNLSGTITVRMVVEGTGHVSRSKVQAPRYMFEHGLLPCVKGAVGRMHFPSTGGATLVTMPINFS